MFLSASPPVTLREGCSRRGLGCVCRMAGGAELHPPVLGALFVLPCLFFPPSGVLFWGGVGCDYYGEEAG